MLIINVHLRVQPNGLIVIVIGFILNSSSQRTTFQTDLLAKLLLTTFDDEKENIFSEFSFVVAVVVQLSSNH